MNKKPWKKYIKWIIIVIIVLFIGNCMTTNIPDEVSIIYKSDPIITYQNEPGWSYHFLKRDLIPEQALQISFDPSYYWNYYNSSVLSVMGRLYITKPYNRLYIKEISYIKNGKKHDLITDKTFSVKKIEDKNILVDENDEPITINGENYYWTSVDFDKEIKKFFIFGLMGQEKEIEVIQIYSFDSEELRNEKITYKVICGGKRFDPMRLIIWMFPP
jgi:hypothetical protein